MTVLVPRSEPIIAEREFTARAGLTLDKCSPFMYPASWATAIKLPVASKTLKTRRTKINGRIFKEKTCEKSTFIKIGAIEGGMDTIRSGKEKSRVWGEIRWKAIVIAKDPMIDQRIKLFHFLACKIAPNTIPKKKTRVWGAETRSGFNWSPCALTITPAFSNPIKVMKSPIPP